MPTSHWVHDLSPFLIRFSENFGIRYYGLAFVLGFVAAAWLMHRYARAGRSQIKGEQITDLMTYIVVGVLVGGRLGYFLLYEPGWLLREPLAFFQVWKGGMASHGGFIGVVVATWWWA
ncbi:MAG: prolipoprotein diacylglyceryl transferase family protein, partial [Verrucomicrobiota bacterium]